MAGLLAWRNLAHDRARLLVTLVGVAFAVALVAIQAGLFLGFSETATTVIANTRADLWVAAKGTQNFETPSPLGEREYYRLRALPGIADAEPLVVQFLPWRRPAGGDEGVIVVGFDTASGIAGPWRTLAGAVADLRRGDTVAVDRIYLDKLGVRGVGDQAEIAGRRARVAVITDGIRSFTTSPWVFASLRTAREMAGLREGEAHYVIAKVAPGHDPDAVLAAARRALPDALVLRSEQFATRTAHYWIHSTGAGAALFTAALLALVVGSAIVAQVLYATTVDHLAEFGTLRAMGAPARFVRGVIAWQAVIAALLGHATGAALALLAARLSENSTALVVVPLALAAVLFFVTLAMCAAGSVVAARKAATVDPALVFQR